MYEYMNPIYLILTALVAFATLMMALYHGGEAQSTNEKMKHPYLFYFFTIISITMLYVDAYEKEERMTSNLQMFQDGQMLRCSGLRTSYLVSLDKGWRVLDKKSITNGDIVLMLNFCEGEDNANHK